MFQNEGFYEEEYNMLWVVFGMLSVVFTVLALCLPRGKMAVWASFCAAAFTMLTLRQEYALTADWVLREDWSALADVVPSMSGMITGYVIGVLLLNAIVIAKATRAEKGVSSTAGNTVKR